MHLMRLLDRKIRPCDIIQIGYHGKMGSTGYLRKGAQLFIRITGPTIHQGIRHIYQDKGGQMVIRQKDQLVIWGKGTNSFQDTN